MIRKFCIPKTNPPQESNVNCIWAQNTVDCIIVLEDKVWEKRCYKKWIGKEKWIKHRTQYKWFFLLKLFRKLKPYSNKCLDDFNAFYHISTINQAYYRYVIQKTLKIVGYILINYLKKL
jgi:hypothetical protein